MPAFLAGRGTGFDPQAVAGRCDPCDHVELVVVLPSFFEKVRYLALSWKWYFEKFCFPASFFRVFLIQLFHSLRLKRYFSFEIGITGAVSRGKSFCP